MLVALAGGVGAARMLSGLVQVTDPRSITAVVNTGDDLTLHGLHISPDIDTVTYTLAGMGNTETGWGVTGETWRAMSALDELGGDTWFGLGDVDLATHLYRTGRLAAGATLSTVTAELAAARHVEVAILPMSDDAVRTKVTADLEGTLREIDFQDYFVRRAHGVPVTGLRFSGADSSAPAPGVLEAIEQATLVVACPSNPLVSIAPILAVRGILNALAGRRADVVAVSPIVAGAALKGPADRLMRELGHEASVTGVARLYAPWAATLIVDSADEAMAPLVEAEGVRCVVAPTLMTTPERAAALARTVLDAHQ